MSATPQSYKSHARFDPAFHFFLVWVLLINLIFTILAFVHHLRHPEATLGGGHLALLTGWMVVMAFAFLVLAAKARGYALKVQDRVIRLEERLRLQSLGVPAPTIEGLTVDQLIALRFASDAELPGLAARAITESLTRKQIKEKITNWRPDNLRV